METSKIQENSQPMSNEELKHSLKDIYCLSGLGADERVFQKLKFKGCQPIHIHWLEPKRGESIADYAQRLTAQITAERPILIGLSFGGMIAVEISKHIATEKIILISSAKNKQEIPFYLRLFRWLPIYLLLPTKLMLWIGQFIASWFFSLKNIDERKLLKAILFDLDTHFLKWGIHQVVTWNNELIPGNIYHIHGDSDRIFPVRLIREDFNVKQGGHLMIMNQAEHISNLIQKIIDMNSNVEGENLLKE